MSTRLTRLLGAEVPIIQGPFGGGLSSVALTAAVSGAGGLGSFGAQWEVISAGVILVILPTLIVFLALQRFIYNGFTAGSTK